MFTKKNSSFISMSLDEIIAKKKADCETSSAARSGSSVVTPVRVFNGVASTSTCHTSVGGKASAPHCAITTVRIPPENPFKASKPEPTLRDQGNANIRQWTPYGKRRRHRARKPFGRGENIGGGPCSYTPLCNDNCCSRPSTPCGGHHNCSTRGGREIQRHHGDAPCSGGCGGSVGLFPYVPISPPAVYNCACSECSSWEPPMNHANGFPCQTYANSVALPCCSHFHSHNNGRRSFPAHRGRGAFHNGCN